MTIQPGTKLGPYEVLAAIGAGGMGEVYKAKDTRLDRVVAIKVLLPHLAAQPDLRERFEREARTVSNLNHPHICTLYDIGQQGHVAFIVMELIEGESLAERLKRGALPIEQALTFAVEIADALDQAHRHGVVHRDLKPANIMVTKAGTKLLDFGLAKLQPSAAVGPFSAQTVLPTQASGLTLQGMILGTLQYMAPEQLEGKDADARTDIFAFGALVYEMATGKRAFEGKSHVTIMAAIVNTEPPPASSIQPATPPALERLLKRCLAKDPDDRWQTARDLLQELKWVSERGPSDKVAAAPVVNTKSLVWWKAAAAMLLLSTIAAAALLYRSGRTDDARTIRFTVSLPEKTTFVSPLGGAAGANGGTLSPDGRYLAFVALDGASGRTQLFVRALEATTAQPVSGTDSPAYPFWSPDSRYIGFFAQGQLKKVQLSGSPPETIADAPSPRGGAWNRDGVIIFAPGNPGAIVRVSAAGGVPTPVTKMDESRMERSHRWPVFLPDGEHFLYYAIAGSDEHAGVWVGSLGSTAPKRLFASSSAATYGPPGYLLFLRENALMAQAFDTSRLELTGEPVRIADQVASDPNASGSGYALGAFSASDHGELSYRSGVAAAETQLTWFDRSGRSVGQLGSPGNYWSPAISPNGRQVVVERRGAGNVDLWIFDLDRATETRLTFSPQADLRPVWSPDGKQIAYTSNRAGGQLYVKEAGGVGEEKPLFESTKNKFPTDWSQDGRTLWFHEFDPKTRNDIASLSLSADGKPASFLQTPFIEMLPSVSPDGRWLAYASDESGRFEVYVQTVPASGSKWQVSTNNGLQTKWRRDGRELFYLTLSGELMSVDTSELRPGSPFKSAIPKLLFKTTVNAQNEVRNFSPTADGQRFLINVLSQQPEASQITVVTNWTRGLRQ